MKKLVSIFFSLLFFCSTIFVSCKEQPFQKTSVFNEKEVVFAFSAMSDIHQKRENDGNSIKLKNALNYSKNYLGGNLDAAIFAGDLTDETWLYKNNDYSLTYNVGVESFKKTICSSVDIQKTAIFYAFGNHDTDNYYNGYEYMKKIPSVFYNQLGKDFFKYDLSDSEIEAGFRHAKIKGYHFISVLPDFFWINEGYSEKQMRWLDNKLKQITEEDPEKFVFIVGHAPLYGTTFGSESRYWFDTSVDKVIKKYPQSVYLSGHIHNFLQNEKNISQNGYYTALDCGGVVGVSSNEWNTEDRENSTFTNVEYSNVSHGLIIEIDRSGNLRITRHEYVSKKVIESPYYIPYPNAEKTHLQAYDNATRKANNQAPYFENGSDITVSKNGDGILLSFTGAKDDDRVFYHKVSVYKKEGNTKEKVGDYYYSTHPEKYTQKEQIPTDFSYTINGDFLGEHVLEIQAFDFFYKQSGIKEISFNF